MPPPGTPTAQEPSAGASTAQEQQQHAAADAPPPATSTCTLGSFLAGRLVEAGASTAFAVPGDFNLALLDELVARKGLSMVWTCNELNAGYAADGYARRKGVGACVVTFGVGGLSVLNAVAGCYAEDLPVIFISGGPNSNDFATNHTLHHTIGLPDLGHQRRMFAEVTCAAVVVQHLDEAHHLIDGAIAEALKQQKPAYLEICCNLAGLTHPSFQDPAIPMALPEPHTNAASLAAAVEATRAVLAASHKPVLLGGPRLRAFGRRDAFKALAEAFQGPVATTPDGKGLFPEDSEQHIGHYWGAISSAGTSETVESADVVVAVGVVNTDYSTLGYTLGLTVERTVSVEPGRVTIQGGATYGCVDCEAFMRALAGVVPAKPAALVDFRRTRDAAATSSTKQPQQPQDGKALTRASMVDQVQAALTSDICVLAETGDSWFNTLQLKLPAGAAFELQLRYGSIGWSVGATLGYSLAAAGSSRRVLAFIGDGSFQMTAQDVGSMMRFGAAPIIILVNNAGYAIEVEIHDGPAENNYNRVVNWDYCALVRSLQHHGKAPLSQARSELFIARAETEEQFAEALSAALSPERAGQLAFIEAVLDTDDVSSQLLEFGARVAAANSRGPRPQ